MGFGRWKKEKRIKMKKVIAIGLICLAAIVSVSPSYATPKTMTLRGRYCTQTQSELCNGSNDLYKAITITTYYYTSGSYCSNEIVFSTDEDGIQRDQVYTLIPNTCVVFNSK